MKTAELTILNISIDELKQLIKDAVCEEINKKRHKETYADSTDYVSRKEVAKMLGISLPTLTKYVKNGTIPAHRIGARILFKQDEVSQSLMQVQKFNFRQNTYD